MSGIRASGDKYMSDQVGVGTEGQSSKRHHWKEDSLGQVNTWYKEIFQ